jgi:hypothetical protein
MEDYPENITLVIHNYVIKKDDSMQTEETKIETEEIAIQTEDEKIETEEIAIQTEETKIKTEEIAIQTEDEKIETVDNSMQTEDEKNKIETTEIAIQTEEIEIEKETEEISIQTDNLSNNDIETQTEIMSISDIPEEIKQLLPNILVENLSSDILLQISKVLSNKNEDVEKKRQEILEKENEIYLRELQIKEIQKDTEIQKCLKEREIEKEKEREIKNPNNIPKIIFVVPYRDREQQYKFFHKQMTKEILVDYPIGSYKIWYIHQCDTRDFNRGAMKNIGFLVAKQLYPNDYRQITLVFNDVDTMPLNRNFLNYETSQGIVKHFYGYEFALGGIVSMNAYDFERINGYPNLWGWGFEDNCLQVRVKKTDIQIDRGQFYPILDKNILQLTDGVTRIVNRNEFDQYYHNTTEGIYSIHDLNYDIDETTGFINIRNFNTGREQDLGQRKLHDLRNGPAPFIPTNHGGKPVRKRNSRMGLFI